MKALHETHRIAVLPAQSVNGATVNGEWVYAGNAVRLFALLSAGALAASVNAKLQQATDNAGTGAKDVTNAAIAALTAADGNKHVSIDLDPDKLDTAGGFGWVRLSVTAGAGACLVAGMVLAESRHQPAAQPTAYVQTVSVY